MKSPDYHISKFKEAYEFHDTYEPSRPFAKLAYGTIRTLMHPTLSVEKETDVLLPEILKKSEPLIIAPNHTPIGTISGSRPLQQAKSNDATIYQ